MSITGKLLWELWKKVSLVQLMTWVGYCAPNLNRIHSEHVSQLNCLCCSSVQNFFSNLGCTTIKSFWQSISITKLVNLYEKSVSWKIPTVKITSKKFLIFIINVWGIQKILSYYKVAPFFTRISLLINNLFLWISFWSVAFFCSY